MKKNILALCIVVLVMPFVLMGCAVPAAQGTTQGAVSEVQLYVIGVIASAILYGLKLLAARFPQWTIKREWLSVLLYAVAWVLSIYWGGVVLPAFPAFNDPVSFVAALFAFVTSLLVALGPSVAFATLIYNIFLKKVFDGAAAKFSISA